MEEYRTSVYQQLEVHHLLDMSIVSHSSVPTKSLISTDTFRKGKKKDAPQNQQLDAETIVPKPSNQSDSTSTPVTVPRIDAASSPKERPACGGVSEPPQQLSPQPDAQRTPPSPEMSGEAEPLTEKAQREASLPIEVYGERLVAGAYSRTWCYREDALLAVYKKLTELSPTTPKEDLKNMTRAAVFLVKKALLDKVSSVFNASLKVLRLLLSQLIPGLGRSEVTHCVDQVWPNLLARTGDSASRVRVTATAFIQEMSLLKDVRALQVIPGELVKPFKSNFPSRLAQSRAELLEKLLAELGTENSGFTLDNVMMFCTAALEHNASAVRELAVRIILSMYQQHRAAVLRFLPPNSAAVRKNFLFKTLFEGFAKIDGKLTLKKGGGQQDGQKEKEEIHSLQEQLAALKEITERREESTKEEIPDEEAPKVESKKAVKTTCVYSAVKRTSPSQRMDWTFITGNTVVEIASLTEHLLGECESRSRFSQCPRCSEAVAPEDLTRHVQGPACNGEFSPPSRVKAPTTVLCVITTSFLERRPGRLTSWAGRAANKTHAGLRCPREPSQHKGWWWSQDEACVVGRGQRQRHGQRQPDPSPGTNGQRKYTREALTLEHPGEAPSNTQPCRKLLKHFLLPR
ncbi:hypothetical protein F7725_000396 [Dissostichus mawsoni]|uniref:Centrosomal protein of 104 kDa n=1 Tax=Dissostichus mawsoni TaxID=36200 RepID=A0A7J5ZG64_DISMA|nr:hypothetical protein F7725_000396 [Dissostichus mawsoni]